MQERSEMQQRQGYQAVEKLRKTLDEKYLWEVILLYAGEKGAEWRLHKGIVDRP